MSLHCDGAEFYRDTEFYVWSVSSILSAGDAPRPHGQQMFLQVFSIPNKSYGDPVKHMQGTLYSGFQHVQLLGLGCEISSGDPAVREYFLQESFSAA